MPRPKDPTKTGRPCAYWLFERHVRLIEDVRADLELPSPSAAMRAILDDAGAMPKPVEMWDGKEAPDE